MSEKSDWEQGYDQAQRRFYEERKVLTARIAELEAHIAELEAHIAELEAHIAELEAHIAELEEAADIEEWDDFPNFPEPPEVV